MSKPKQPTTMQRVILDRCRTTTLAEFKESDGQKHLRFVDGSPVNGRVARNCIQAGWLVPANDGLFPGFTQTFRLSERAP